MSRGIAAKLTGTLLMMLIIHTGACAQDDHYPLRIMFYNVENLFDIHDDPLTDDEEFLPSGLRRWNYSRYNKKINSIYKVIIAAGEWEPPAAVAICEAENRGVLEDIVYGTNLSKYNYRIIHEDSPDQRGIDVCLIYRQDIVDVMDYQYINPFPDSSEFRTRSILYARMLAADDTLHLIVNHWPSRRGGVLAAEDERIRIAQILRSLVDSIAFIHPEPRIIVMGDFNSSPDDQVMSVISGSAGGKAAMINLSAVLPRNSGTYRYHGVWEIIDQVLVSNTLIKCSRGLYTGEQSLKVFKPDFLLKKDTQYPGLSPFSTYSGYRYQGGFSDHLPVLLDLFLR